MGTQLILQVHSGGTIIPLSWFEDNVLFYIRLFLSNRDLYVYTNRDFFQFNYEEGYRLLAEIPFPEETEELLHIYSRFRSSGDSAHFLEGQLFNEKTCWLYWFLRAVISVEKSGWLYTLGIKDL